MVHVPTRPFLGPTLKTTDDYIALQVFRRAITPPNMIPNGFRIYGDVTMSGTLNITGTLFGAGAWFSTINLTGNVANSTGNVTVADNLDVSGDVNVGSGKATIAAATGNTVIAGTLQVTGAQTLTGRTAINGVLPSVRAARSAAQTLTTGVWTAISLDTETWDTDGYFAPTSKVITIPAGLGGLYQISVSALFANNLTGFRGAAAAINDSTDTANGTAFDGLNQTNAAGGSTFRAGPYSDLVRLAAGDTVTLKAIQTSGGNLDVSSITANRLYGTAIALVRLGG